MERLVKPHYVTTMNSWSARLAKPVVELVIDLKMGKPCVHNRCTFCGLKDTEPFKRKEPLSVEEVREQVLVGFEPLLRNGRVPEKVALISNIHSVLTPDVVTYPALISLIEFLAKEGVQELSLETRIDLVLAPEVRDILFRIRQQADSYRMKIEIAFGLETPSERERNEVMQKGLKNERVIEGIRELSRYSFALRSYHILVPPTVGSVTDRTYMSEMAKLLEMLKFLHDIRDGTLRRPDIPIQLYVNVDYGVPGLPDFQSPDISKLVMIMDFIATTAKSRGISLYLDLVQEDSSCVGSSTSRVCDQSLLDQIAQRNRAGWIYQFY